MHGGRRGSTPLAVMFAVLLTLGAVIAAPEMDYTPRSAAVSELQGEAYVAWSPPEEWIPPVENTVNFAPLLFPLQTTVPAIPGGAGHGMDALNSCRSLPVVVHKVTSLSATGTGSIDAAFENASSSNLDFILADTSGVITGGGTSVARLTASCVVVAMHTGGGGGLVIHNDSLTDGGLLRIGDGNPITDVVFMGGSSWKDACPDAQQPGCSQQDNFSVINAQDVVLYRWSWIGAEDEVVQVLVSTGQTMSRFTISHNLISSAWSTGLNGMTQLGVGSTGGIMREIDYHHNAYIWPEYRVPTAISHSSGRTAAQDTIKDLLLGWNQIYGWGSRGIIFQAHADNLSLVKNTYKPNGSDTDAIFELDGDYQSSTGDPDITGWGLYYEGNVHTDAICGATDRNWWDNCTESDVDTPIAADSTGHDAGARPTAPTYAYEDETAAAANTELIVNKNVGGSIAISCAGVLSRRTNALDSLYLEDMENGTTVMDNVADAFDNAAFWPTIAQANKCADSDGDGLFDLFESTYGVTTPGDDTDLDGWLDIEEMLHGMDPTVVNLADGSEVGGGPEAPPWDPTFFIGTDSAIQVYTVDLTQVDTVITGGGTPDTLLARRWRVDSLPVGTVFEMHPICIAGDTLALISTSDTLIVGVDTTATMSIAEINQFGVDHGLPNCTSTNVRNRKVHGVAWHWHPIPLGFSPKDKPWRREVT